MELEVEVRVRGLTLTFNPKRAMVMTMVMTHTHGKVKVNGYSVQKVRAETDRGDCITYCANVVYNNLAVLY